MMLPRSPRPRNAFSLTMFSEPPGCMKTSVPSSAAFAQNGSYFGFDRSSPLTCPPIETPRRPRRLPSSSCCAARSGNCSATDVIATKRVGLRRHDLGRALRSAPARSVVARSRSAAYHQKPIDADGLHVDALLIHQREPLRPDHLVAGAAAGVACERRALDDLGDLRNHAVAVHVDDAHALAADRDLAPGGRRLRREKIAAEDEAARRGARGGLEEVPAIRHRCSPGGPEGPPL